MAAAVDFLNEVAKHPLGRVEVGDDTVLEWTDRHDASRGPTDHSLGFRADGEDATGVAVDRHHGRLIQHDSAATHVDQRVRRAKVDGHIAADERGAGSHNATSLRGSSFWRPGALGLKATPHLFGPSYL